MVDFHTNPYIGQRAFTHQEQDIFFGRDREVRELFSLVVSERLVLFYAPEGAGKTSLLNAGLIPQLQTTEFAVLPVAHVGGPIPPDQPDVENIYIFNLMMSLCQTRLNAHHFTDMPLSQFLHNLTSDDEIHYHYDDTIDTETSDYYEERPTVLIIDQFEEIVTTHLNHWPERSDFFKQLDQAMMVDPQLWIVLALREESLAALERYANLVTDKFRAQFQMTGLDDQAALDAIQKPAEIAGRPFAPKAAKQIVEYLHHRSNLVEKTTDSEFIDPRRLQAVCYQLWDSLQDHAGSLITLQDMQQSGIISLAPEIVVDQ